MLWFQSQAGYEFKPGGYIRESICGFLAFVKRRQKKSRDRLTEQGATLGGD